MTTPAAIWRAVSSPAFPSPVTHYGRLLGILCAPVALLSSSFRATFDRFVERYGRRLLGILCAPVALLSSSLRTTFDRLESFGAFFWHLWSLAASLRMRPVFSGALIPAVDIAGALSLPSLVPCALLGKSTRFTPCGSRSGVVYPRCVR